MTPVAYFFLHTTTPTDIYTLSLHDALPISIQRVLPRRLRSGGGRESSDRMDSARHSEHRGPRARPREPALGARARRQTNSRSTPWITPPSGSKLTASEASPREPWVACGRGGITPCSSP